MPRRGSRDDRARPLESVGGALLLTLGALGLGCPTADDSPEPDAPLYDSRIVEDDGRATFVVCPGSLGCEADGDTLKASAAVRDVTPVVEAFTDENENGSYDIGEPFVDENNNAVFDPVWMAGFDMGRLATGVNDPITVRALVLERGETRIALVVIDTVGYFQPEVMALRLAAAERNFDLDHIMMASTHNHEAPDTMGIWGPDPSTTGINAAWMETIRTAALDALAEAIPNLTAVDVTAAQTSAPQFIDDSRLPEVKDASLTGFRFTSTAGDEVATVAIYGNHVESLGGNNTHLTSDYAHYLRDALTARYPGTTPLFFAGNVGGLMNPLHATVCPGPDGSDACAERDFVRAAALGEGVAAILGDALDAAPVVSSADAELTLRRAPFLQAIQNLPLLVAAKFGLFERDGYYLSDQLRVQGDRFASLSTDEILNVMGVATEVNALRLAGAELLFVPGELYPELYLSTDEGESYVEAPADADFPDAPRLPPLLTVMPAATLHAVVNNANDALGYIIPKRQYDAAPPYAYDKPEGQYGEQNSIGPDAAPTVHSAVSEMYALTP